jgi:hypothetical protein
VSDIFNPPSLPDPTIIECPDCGAVRGRACGAPQAEWNCGSRIWIVNRIAAIERLKQPEPPAWSPSRDDYAAGWNDAITAITERLRGVRR